MSSKEANRKPSAGAESIDSSEVQESAVLGAEDFAEEVVAEVERTSRLDQMIRITPIHAAPGGRAITRSVVGRPRKVERRPAPEDLEYHQQMALQREEFIGLDPIVRAIAEKSDSADMLRKVKMEVAQEAAALHFQRIENEKFGKDTAQVSTRRIDALTKIASIELEIKKMGADTVNLKSEKQQRVFKYLIDVFREGCAETGMSSEAIDLLFNWLSTHLEGWEDKAAELVR